MKLNHPLIRFSIILFALLLINVPGVSAKDVAGVVDKDTTWTANETPHELTGPLTISSGATLFIEPGVKIRGKNNVRAIIKVDGKLHARGSAKSNILADNTSFILSKIDSELMIEYGAIETGKIICQRGNVLLGNSSFKGSKVHLYSYEGKDSYIEKNIFKESILKIGTIGKATVHVVNNAFYDYRDKGVLAYNLAAVVLKHNSFMSREGIAVEIRLHEHLDATENFWNTSDTKVIDAMIFDRDDDTNVDIKVKYTPFLSSPHPATPAP